MSNSLTRRASLKLGPLILETLVKHYFDRIRKDASKSGIDLRKDELLYDEAFSIVKEFLDAATRHTVEELQSFSNTRTPSPPWVRVVRVVIPMSCCDEAATHLIKAFGGEEVMKRTVGGTKWWQVRGIRGVQVEWITAKKDWQEAKRRSKEQKDSSSTRRKGKGTNVNFGSAFVPPAARDAPDGSEKEKVSHPVPEDSGTYQPEMDEMRCILYSHGGGYYFGSVDQERYSIQRYARKMHGRVLAINYRLAPQYPFPCAIQDLLAAYLYLIRPPEGSMHRPVSPGHIVIAGDSAGGGLSLALLQVIRDAGLPPPAGGVLISPWCDFTHSFPSIFTNTDTDVIPVTGLSIHKPSSLWPPPPDDMSLHVRNRLRTTIHEVIHHTKRAEKKASQSEPHLLSPPTLVASSSAHGKGAFDDANIQPKFLPSNHGRIEVGSTASLPPPGSLADQTVWLRTPEGENIEIAQQIQLYAPNGLLKHPLVSPALSYLGDLPPLFFIASDKEVLRDEVIYAAHRAAYPERYPIRQEVKDMYPVFEHLDDRIKPTPVHLQVYDDAAHVLPVLFSFTTPAKYCYRAIASFCKHVTNMTPTPQSPISPSVPTFTYSPASMTPMHQSEPDISAAGLSAALRASSSISITGASSNAGESPSRPQAPRTASVQLQRQAATSRNSLSSGLSQAASSIRRRSSLFVKTAWNGESMPSSTSATRPCSPNSEQGPSKEDSGDVAGPRFGESSVPHPKEEVLAGDPVVYEENWAKPVLHRRMIRERISIQGVVRPLEPEGDLPALHVPPELIGTLSERAIRRYVNGRDKFDKKYSSTTKAILKHRRRNLERASEDMSHHISQLQHYLARSEEAKAEGHDTVRQGILGATPSLAWMLDADERPPPSSIVARRDTEEAIKLARVADQSIVASESALNANNLWSVVMNFLTVAPEKQGRSSKAHAAEKEKRKRRLRFADFWKSRRSGAKGARENGKGDETAKSEEL